MRWAVLAGVVLVAGGSAVGQQPDAVGGRGATPAPGAAPGPIVDANVARTPPVPTLRLGDPAPAIGQLTWVRGPMYEALPPGRVMVVEFTASTCVPCRHSAQLLSDMQVVYKDKGLGVLGICVGEQNGAADAQAWARAMGPQIGYALACDTTGGVAQAWMAASGQSGLPTAFVVDRVGRIAWIGNTLDGLERVVPGVLDGTYDLERARAETARRSATDAKSRPLVGKLEDAFKKGDAESALGVMDQLAAVDPPLTSDWIVTKFGYLLLERKDSKRAYAYAASAMDGVAKDDAAVLKALAWMILTEPGAPRRDVPMARRMAERADAITSHADPSVLDTLAKAQADDADLDGAIATLTKALDLVKMPTQKREMQGRLEQYKAAREALGKKE